MIYWISTRYHPLRACLTLSNKCFHGFKANDCSFCKVGYLVLVAPEAFLKEHKPQAACWGT